MAKFIVFIKRTQYFWNGRTWADEWIEKKIGYVCKEITGWRNWDTGWYKGGRWRNSGKINDGNWWENEVWFKACVRILIIFSLYFVF